MSYSIFLDDIREPSDVKWVDLPRVEWVIVRDYLQFVDVIKKKGIPGFVAYDHDLAFEHYPFSEQNPSLIIPYNQYTKKTGYDCAKWLKEYCHQKGVDHPPFIVHSMNPVGRQNINNLLGKNHFENP